MVECKRETIRPQILMLQLMAVSLLGTFPQSAIAGPQEEKTYPGYRKTVFANPGLLKTPRAFHIWYPTRTPSAKYRYNPVFTGQTTLDAVLSRNHRIRPLVLISHGWDGVAVSLAYLAEALAGSGFVVAAIDHDRDKEFSSQESMKSRANDLLALIDHVQKSGVGPAVDFDSIGILGFSRGGLSAMMAGGLLIHPPEASADLDFEQRGFAYTMAGFSWPTKKLHPNIKAVVAIAALGAGMAYPGDHPLPILAVSGTLDKTIPPRTNTDLLVPRLRAAGWPVRDLKIDGAAHFSFLGPCTLIPKICRDTKDAGPIREKVVWAVQDFLIENLM